MQDEEKILEQLKELDKATDKKSVQNMYYVSR